MVDHKVTRGISLICDLCKKCFDSEISLINHSLNHPFDPYVCNVCDKNFYFETELLNHLKSHAKQKDSFGHRRNASTHAKYNKEPINKNVEQQVIHYADFSLLCNSAVENSLVGLNDKKVVNKPGVIKSKEIKQMVKYKLSNSELNFACVICSECFADEQDLLNHSLNQHSDQAVYQCVVCDDKFSNKHELVNHGETHLFEESGMHSLYDGKLHECITSDNIDESSPERGYVKVRYLFQSVDKSYNQNTKQHLSTAQKRISDSCNNIISDKNSVSKVSYSGSSDTCISMFQDRELSTTFSANILSEILNKANSGICKNYDNVPVSDKYDHAAQIKISKKNICGENGKTKNKIIAKLNNEQEPLSKSEITIFASDGVNSNVKKGNSLNSDPLESYCIAYNHETNEFEMFIDSAQCERANISPENLDIHKVNPKTKDVCSTSKRSKSIETDGVIQNTDYCDGSENEISSIQNRISNVRTVDACIESKRTSDSRKNGTVGTYIDAEDYNDISGIVAVVCNEDSNSVVTTYEVCELEVVDTCNKNSSIQSSETCSLESDTVQKNSANQDVENAVADIKMELCNDKSSLESFNGHRMENTDSLNNHVDQTSNPMQGDIVLTDVTQIKEQTFLSDLFGGKFVNENNVIKHISPCIKPKTDICHICKKAYSSKLALLRHIYIHSGEKPFSCNFCNKKYSRKYDLNDHLLSHTGQKPHTCPVCNKGFLRKSHVEKHLLIHSDEKPYLCDVCGKNFSRKDYLIGHRLNHVDNNPFMCPTCDQTFSEREELDAHRAIHAVQVSYVCAVCKKRFTQKRHLERHFSIHTGEKPFRCDICNKHFARKDALYTHKKSHRKEKSHECSECGKFFSQKLNFLRHIQMHTSEKASNGKKKKKLSMQTFDNSVLDNTSS